MEERKSWAGSQTATRQHAVFECLAHNLYLLMEFEMNRRGLRDEVEAKKNKGREGSRRNAQTRLAAKKILNFSTPFVCGSGDGDITELIGI